MTPLQTTEALGYWQLERFLLDELPPDEAEAVWRAREADEQVSVRLRAIERSDAEILARHPPEVMAARIRARLGRANHDRATGGSRRTVLAAAASVAAVASVVVVRPFWPASHDPAATRVKGLRSQLLLFRKAPATGVERLVPGSVAHDRDLLQVAYQVTDRSHGVIVSVDGRGTLTRHLPVTGTEAAPLQTGATVPLPAAYELDDAPRFERFYLVTADAPFPVATVEDAVRRQHRHGAPGDGHLDLPVTMDQFTFVLRKESSP
jgi:hypothetical protein